MEIALLFAMREEIAAMLNGERTPLLLQEAGVEFYRIRPGVIACCGGVGKVNAAMATQLLIDRFHPELIINAGVAGCFENVSIGTLVLAEGFIQHDFDISTLDDCQEGFVATVHRVVFPTSWQDRARAAMDAVGLPYRTGIVATGDWFATDTPRARHIAEVFHPLLCEMEGCAAAQVCYRNEVPFMAIKSVSDCLFGENDFTFQFPAALARLNEVVLSFIDKLEVPCGTH